MLCFGNIAFPMGAGLAPMAGVTSLPFRVLAKEMGAAWTVTEMCSAKGLCYMGKEHRANADILERNGEGGILGVQLFGHEEVYMTQAAQMLSDDGFAFIDINMGCPAPKVSNNGDGSALMKDPLLAGRIVEATVKATSLPVTVKMRLGWDEGSKNFLEVARICEESGASAVTIHARTRQQQYAGTADWDAIGAVKSALHIPVIGNGDVKDGASALRMLRETHCDAVACGRGAMGNPWLFQEIRCAMEGTPFTPPDFAQRIDMALRQMDLLLLLKGERAAVPEMRSHIAWYLKGARSCARLRNEVNNLQGAQAVREKLMMYRESYLRDPDSL